MAKEYDFIRGRFVDVIGTYKNFNTGETKVTYIDKGHMITKNKNTGEKIQHF